MWKIKHVAEFLIAENNTPYCVRYSFFYLLVEIMYDTAQKLRRKTAAFRFFGHH